MYLFIRDMLRDKSLFLSTEQRKFIRDLVAKFEPYFVEIRPCPLCGSIHCDFVYDDGMVWVACKDCGAMSGDYTSKEAAAIAWNFRTILPQRIEELHPCPICGTDNIVVNGEREIRCQRCGFNLFKEVDCPDAKIYSVVERWNRRTNEVSVVQEIDFIENLKYRVC